MKLFLVFGNHLFPELEFKSIRMIMFFSCVRACRCVQSLIIIKKNCYFCSPP